MIFMLNVITLISSSDLARMLLVVLADQNSGVYILDFRLGFSNATGYFSAGSSSFTIRKLNLPDDDYDNVEWSKDGSIFIQMDNSVGKIIRYSPSSGTIANVAYPTGSGER